MQNNTISLKENAIQIIKAKLLADPELVGVRFGIQVGGCQGLTYTLDYLKEVDQADVHIQHDDIDVYIDPKAVLFLNGMEVDYKDSGITAGFTFENPNAAQRCGCGVSFCPKNPPGGIKGGGCGGGCS